MASHSEKPSASWGDLGKSLRSMLLARPRVIHLVLLFICVILGFALVTQARSQQSDPLETMSQNDLVILLDELNTREETLRSDRTRLNAQLTDLQDSYSDAEAAAKAAQDARQQAEINAGIVPVHGPGLYIGVADPSGSLRASDFVTVLGELRNSGAEAVSLNDVRLNATSWFERDDEGIIVSGTRIQPPYQWKVIGDAKTISVAMEIQGGAASQLRGQRATVTIDEVDDVVIDATTTLAEPQFAQVSPTTG